MSVVKKQVTIANANGLHARPAGKIVATANEFSAEINIYLNGRQADARSIIALMTLTATCGSEVEVEASGDDAEAALAAIVDLIEGKFEEQ